MAVSSSFYAHATKPSALDDHRCRKSPCYNFSQISSGGWRFMGGCAKLEQPQCSYLAELLVRQVCPLLHYKCVVTLPFILTPLYYCLSSLIFCPSHNLDVYSPACPHSWNVGEPCSSQRDAQDHNGEVSSRCRQWLPLGGPCCPNESRPVDV